ncbi:MAG: NUDIX domain-containing protein [Candidatus Bathyarchaeota archaeon]|nr:MAG: NUDIX domain-containing protein [Candidatus Bathyarchaeota archaeon]
MIIEKSAGLIIYRLDNCEAYFLLLRYGWGHWGFSKGIIESGETEIKAAIREAKEETGLNNFKIIDNFKENIEYFYRKAGETIHKKVTYFIAKTEGINVKISFEHTGYEWLRYEKALQRLSFENTKMILRKAKKTIARKYNATNNVC